MSIDEELRRTAVGIDGLSVMSARDVAAAEQRLAERYVLDPSTSWWWDSLRPGLRGEQRPYGQSDPWELITGLAPPRLEYVLLVTDDHRALSCAFRGPLASLATLVAESPFFEYVVTDDDASFAIFDTHHNVLISVSDTR